MNTDILCAGNAFSFFLYIQKLQGWGFQVQVVEVYIHVHLNFNANACQHENITFPGSHLLLIRNGGKWQDHYRSCESSLWWHGLPPLIWCHVCHFLYASLVTLIKSWLVNIITYNNNNNPFLYSALSLQQFKCASAIIIAVIRKSSELLRFI